MNKNIHQFEIKQKQAFIRRKQIWIGPVILCPTYSTQSLFDVKDICRVLHYGVNHRGPPI